MREAYGFAYQEVAMEDEPEEEAMAEGDMAMEDEDHQAMDHGISITPR